MKSEYVFRVAKAIMLSAMLALGISLPACASGDDAQDQSHYQLSFDADTPRQVHVEAQVTVTGQRLRMFLYGQPFLENGWATWVEDLQASTTDGTPVEARLREGGWGSWEIDVPDGTRVNLSYTVNLTQDEYDWDSVGGQDGRPTWSNGAFYGVTRAFFIYSDHDQQMTVQIDRPRRWHMHARWPRLGAGIVRRGRPSMGSQRQEQSVRDRTPGTADRRSQPQAAAFSPPHMPCKRWLIHS